ncbi:expressed unknown protein [Seminavis robusta]|uniref:Uncharacterized protein n=1 Tax=Seminavis robusta TaxID=568900 RepID=A0A9N8EUT7_9STRA|nr:expressed unknown protein [Seminavis robusta]|eukprot:Sro1824_g300020.1 n/a (608) ;mRNA; f:16559-18382
MPDHVADSQKTIVLIKDEDDESSLGANDDSDDEDEEFQQLSLKKSAKTKYPPGSSVQVVYYHTDQMLENGNATLRVHKILVGKVRKVGIDWSDKGNRDTIYKVKVLQTLPWTAHDDNDNPRSSNLLSITEDQLQFAMDCPVWLWHRNGEADEARLVKAFVIASSHYPAIQTEARGERDATMRLRYTVQSLSSDGGRVYHGVLPEQLTYRASESPPKPRATTSRVLNNNPGQRAGEKRKAAETQNSSDASENLRASRKSTEATTVPPITAAVQDVHREEPEMEMSEGSNSHDGMICTIENAGDNSFTSDDGDKDRIEEEQHNPPAAPAVDPNLPRNTHESFENVPPRIQETNRSDTRRYEASRNKRAKPISDPGAHVNNNHADKEGSKRKGMGPSIYRKVGTGSAAHQNTAAARLASNEPLPRKKHKASRKQAETVAKRKEAPHNLAALLEKIDACSTFADSSLPVEPLESLRSTNNRSNEIKTTQAAAGKYNGDEVVKNTTPSNFVKIAFGRNHQIEKARHRLATDPGFGFFIAQRCLRYHLMGACRQSCPLSNDHIALDETAARCLEKRLMRVTSETGPIFCGTTTTSNPKQHKRRRRRRVSDTSK